MMSSANKPSNDDNHGIVDNDVNKILENSIDYQQQEQLEEHNGDSTEPSPPQVQLRYSLELTEHGSENYSSSHYQRQHRSCIANTAFHCAVLNHDYDMLEHYLSSSNKMFSVHRSRMDGKKPIHLAWYRLRLDEIISYTIAPWNRPNDIESFIQTVTILLQHKVNINSCDNSGKTLLNCMCFESCLQGDRAFDAIMLLMNNGAEPNIGGVLHWAAANCYRITEQQFQELLSILVLDHHVIFDNQILDRMPNSRRTMRAPIHFASYLLFKCQPPAIDSFKFVVTSLLSCGVDINILDSDGRTLLSRICYVLRWKVNMTIYDAVLFLLSHGANPNIGVVQNGWTLLPTACHMGDLIMVKLLLIYHPSDVALTTALHTVRKSNENYKEIMSLLLKHGANINGQDSSGNSILHVALLRRHPNAWIVKFLIDVCHADYLLTRNHDGKSPREIIMEIQSQYYTKRNISKHKKKRYEKFCYFMEQKRRHHIYSDLLRIKETSLVKFSL